MTPRELEIMAVVGEWIRIGRRDVVEFGESIYQVADGSDIDVVTLGTVNGEPAIIGFAEFRIGPNGRFKSRPICYKRR